MPNRFAMVVLLLVLLGACGQKGDLYLRDEPAEATAAQQEADQERAEEEQDDEE